MRVRGMESPGEGNLGGYRYGVRRSFRVSALFWAVVLQIILLVAAVFVVVVVPNLRKDPEFVAKKTIYLPQRELDHSMALSEYHQMSSKPVLMERLTTESMLSSDLPRLPELPATAFDPFQSPFNPLNDAAALLREAGLMGSLQGLVSESSAFSFFGIEDQAQRIVIVFDISQSVVTKARKSGISMGRLQSETLKLIESLNANTLFGLIQFSRNYDLFENYLVSGTQANKAAAGEWLKREFRTDGKSGRNWVRDPVNGIQSVIKAAFHMQPDVLFILSDGDFQRTTPEGGSQNVPFETLAGDIRSHQQQSEKNARIHFIGFQVKPQHTKPLQSIIRRNDGKFREL